MAVTTDTSLKAIGTRLRELGHTWQEITEILYGHPGNQAYYTVNGHQTVRAPKVAPVATMAHPGYFIS